MGKPQTWDHLRGKKKPVTRSVRIPLDPEVAEEYEEARKDFESKDRIKNLRPSDPEVTKEWKAAKDRKDEAEAAFKESSYLFKFRAVGRARYDAMIDENPPTQEQLDEFTEKTQAMQKSLDKAGVASQFNADQQLPWNPDTFPVVLLAESSVDPKLSLEDAQEIWESDDWNTMEITALFTACLEANQSFTNTRLGKG